jgi:hypothetical protein
MTGAHIAAKSLVRRGGDKSVQFCTDGSNIALVVFFPVRTLAPGFLNPPKLARRLFCRSRAGARSVALAVRLQTGLVIAVAVRISNK